MRTRRGGARARRGILVSTLLGSIGLLAQGCPASNAPSAPVRSAASVAPSRFVAIEDTPPLSDEQDLLHEALAGTASDGDALDARLQVRPVRLPHPARGGNARFNFGQGQRGWITAMPSAELLTTAAFGDGKLYLGGGFASHQFYALDAYSGELRWSMAAPDGGPTAAILDDGKVLFNTESCTLFVADAETGTLRWSRWLGDPLMSQPASANGIVVSAYPKNGGHEFGAFRLSDGEPVWTIAIPADVIQAPQIAGGEVYFATMDGTAHRVALRTGQVRWARDVGASSALWVDRDRVMLARRADRPGAGTPTEKMLVLDARSGRVLHEGPPVPAPYLRGDTRDRELGSGQAGAWGNVRHGEHLGLRNVAAGWAFQGSSPAVADGRAYFAIGSEIHAREIESGRTVWQRRYAQAGDAQAVSPPAVVGSLLVFGTIDGQLFASDIDTGMTVWAYEIGEPIVFQPTVAQGWVYVTTGRGNVIGLELGDAMLDGWHMWGGNARHAGLVETAGQVDPHLLASLDRPSQGMLRAVAASEAEAVDADEEDEEERAPAAFEEHPLPLRGTEVRARVSGPVAEVFVTQRFVNDGDRPIEAVYLFPLPPDAAVDRMEMRIGERVVRGVIRGRQEARQEYEAARSTGRRAALLEQQRPNLFAQRVANIAPGDQIDVRLRYVQALPYEDGHYELAFPMIAPRRYDPSGPGAGSPDPVSPDAVNAAAVHASEQPPVALAVELEAGLTLASIASPSHASARITHAGAHAQADLRAEREDVTRDFVLRWSLAAEEPDATLLAHREAEDGFFTLLVQPPVSPTDAQIAPRDVTFVLDTSSSMHGRPLAQAQSMLRAAIRGLRPSDRFNVLGFSDRVARLAPSPIANEGDAEARAIAFVDGLRATGATEMIPAIEQALSAPASRDRLSIVVLVTDGYIANEADVLRALATHLSASGGAHRVYAFGVGGAVNRFLVERAAEIGRGRALVVGLSEDPDAAARRFATWIDRPVFTDVSVDFGDLRVTDVYPRRAPDLFAGKPLAIHGRFAGGGRATVRVRGTMNGRRYERAIEVALPTSATPEGPHASQASLWARAAVHDRLARLTLRDDPALIEEVTALGLAHHLVTPYTSFVAIEERPVEPSDEDAEAEAQPTVTPGRVLPGDPEIRVPAPADARAVTIVLPFGESSSAIYEPSLHAWTARFLIPRDQAEGTYPIEVLITHADGRLEHLRVFYTVDESAALVNVEAVGEVRPGAEITFRATQVITGADLAQIGRAPGELSAERVQLLSDARRVELRAPSGEGGSLESAGPGTWSGTWRVPADAQGTLRFEVISVDLAANVRTSTLELAVQQ